MPQQLVTKQKLLHCSNLSVIKLNEQFRKCAHHQHSTNKTEYQSIGEPLFCNKKKKKKDVRFLNGENMSKKVARIIKYLVQICLPVFTWPQHIWCQLTRTYSAERLKHTANMNCKTQTKLSINKNLTYVHEQLHTAQLGQKKKKTTLVKLCSLMICIFPTLLLTKKSRTFQDPNEKFSRIFSEPANV